MMLFLIAYVSYPAMYVLENNVLFMNYLFLFLFITSSILGFRELFFEKEKFKNAYLETKPYLKQIDSFVHNRMEFLANSQPSKRFVALISVLLSTGIVFIGFIPMMPALLAIPILFFALGLSVQDGILMAIGYFAFIISIIVTPLMIA